MLYYTNNGNSISINYILDNTEKIEYFTLSEVGIFTCDEDGENPSFKELQFSDDFKYKQIIKELDLFKIKEYVPEEWFLRPKVSDEHRNEYYYRVNIFQFNTLTKGILLKYSPNIVFKDNNNLMHLPQDLCFFNSQGDLLMGTLSHENIAVIMMSKTPNESELKKNGLSILNDQVVIPVLEL